MPNEGPETIRLYEQPDTIPPLRNLLQTLRSHTSVDGGEDNTNAVSGGRGTTLERDEELAKDVLDGGWGWFVLIGCVLENIIVCKSKTTCI